MNGSGQNFLRLIRTGQLTDDPNIKIPPVLIRLLEVIIILAVMYGGFKVTFNNLQTDVSDLKIEFKTESKDKEKRVTVLETNYTNIEKFMDRIEKKIDSKLQ